MSELTAEVVRSIDAINENQWNHVVENGPTGTVFHRTGWLRAIEEGLGHEPRHIVVRKKNNPVAVFPNFRSAVETPFEMPVDAETVGLGQLSSVTPGFGGPVIIGDKDDCIERLFDTVEDLCGWNTIVHRLRILDSNHVQYAQTLHERGYHPSHLYCRFWLQLDDYNRIWESMDGNRRREIRNGNEYDPVVETESVSRSSVDRFYTEYQKTIDRVDGTRYPRQFFTALADHLADRLEIFTASVDGDPAGQHLCLRDEEQNSLHYFFAGIDEAYFEYSSPAVIHDRSIEWAIENGYSVYDFGATSSHYRDGTFNYKRKFGAQMEPVYEWEAGQAPVRWASYKKGRERYLQRAPASR